MIEVAWRPNATGTGTFDCADEPLPSWPFALLPAHQIAPLVSSTHANVEPSAICATFANVDNCGVVCGCRSPFGSLALPNWPLGFAPQHHICCASAAHVVLPFAAIVTSGPVFASDGATGGLAGFLPP